MSFRDALIGSLFMLLPSLIHAQVDYGHFEPVTHAHVEFAEDFPALSDSEWGFPMGGFGGVREGLKPAHVPVIFVHGNNTDACDWKLVRDDFRAAGWSDQALWALSYNGLGNNVGNAPERPDPRCQQEHNERNGGDSVSRITNNDLNVPDLHAFIQAVRSYTGSPRFSIVSHSLGVTLARKTLQVHPELRQHLVAFVGIAGANHGTSLCPPGSAGLVFSCDELEAGSAWLDDLNGPDSRDESFAPARWMTIYDGTGTGDVGYAPGYENSPRLLGAENLSYPGTAHNALRVDPTIVATYRRFLEVAETTFPNGDRTMSSSTAGSTGILLMALLLIAACRQRLIQGLMLMTLAGAAQAQLPPPLPAPTNFPDDFESPLDSEHGFALGGFGGQPDARLNHVPVIFVHGNTSDACDWLLVRDDFRAAGWSDMALWALSYNGLGADKGQAPGRHDPRCHKQRATHGGDGLPRITSNEVNVDDLAGFIRAVQAYTGSRAFSLVGHSLGVTLARRTLQAHPGLRPHLVAFVGIAGGNHGTSLCPPGTEKMFPGCAELAATGSAWLEQLNGPDGREETYPPTRWMTIFDGSGEADVAYQGPLADSPRLRGADNRRYPGTSHNDLRVRPDIVAAYRTFLEAASTRWLRRQRYLLGR